MSTAVMESKTASRASFKPGSREYFITRRMLQKQIWPIIGYKPHAKQQEVHNAVMRGARFIMSIWGRRAGKSEMVAAEHLIELAFPPFAALPLSLVDIVAPESDITDKIFRYLWHWIIDLKALGHEPTDASKRERYIQLPWRARLEGRTADNPGSLMGDGIVQRASDESAKYKNGQELAIQFLHPPLADTLGRIFDTTTPKGKNDAYTQWQDWDARMRAGDRRYFVSHATSYDNPYVPAGEIDRIREYCEQNGMEVLFNQEYMAEFVSFTGSVYPQFQPVKLGEPWHVQAIEPLESISLILGIDWGFRNPFVCLIAQIRGDKVFILDEIYITGRTDQECAEAVLAATKGHHISLGYADPSSPEAIATFVKNGIPMYQPSAKAKTRINNVNDGITAVRQLLGIDAFPSLQISPKCVNLIRELEAYSFSDRAIDEKPVKDSDHACDALRYMVVGAVGASDPLPVWL